MSTLKKVINCEECGSSIQLQSLAGHQKTQKCRAARLAKLSAMTKRAAAQDLKTKGAVEDLVEGIMQGAGKAKSKTKGKVQKAKKGGLSAFEQEAERVEMEDQQQADMKKQNKAGKEEEEGEAEAGGEESDYDQEDEFEEETEADQTTEGPPPVPSKAFSPPLGTGIVTPTRTYRDFCMILKLYTEQDKILGKWERRINSLQNNQKKEKVIAGVKEFLLNLIRAEVYHLRAIRDNMLTANPGQCVFDPTQGRWGDPKYPAQAQAVRNAYNLAATAATILGNEEDE